MVGNEERKAKRRPAARSKPAGQKPVGQKPGKQEAGGPRPDPALDPREVQKFAALADQWWDPAGPMAPLHAMNPWRIGVIRDAICRQFGGDPAQRTPLVGRSLLDIGCGAGLLCEPMARLGAEVTGIDPAAEVITAARLHAEEQELRIDYREATVADLAAEDRRFDVVTALEVVEHAEDPERLVQEAAACVAEGGLLVVSTIARTNRAWLQAIVAAEYLLRWLPAGTHDWRRFVQPSELARWVRGSGLVVQELRGVTWDARTGRFVDAPRPDVNYLLVAARL
ncbi:bifunctional 2-polyprenyl-6-hydroxyphenol methylase/3-demethylubiquinol 3-O-methyltransferase UbiG [Geminicoccus harenae]|uniref:bifunctional 2-polyprenyl-6-hydroxyphenol methylase/3-demethylubiquinol 3-O-methyltransferase UbiG n=1 Tax=Geminicoccus harenae TaxID=2498453 RepID=UPI00168B6E37|nr:bifunctional 2-polyprenyl-6-hydroxyphenol methylase/3-demethylubiquinol 3-O-methyltransferase UbiG [Geminicoccus harenae]